MNKNEAIKVVKTIADFYQYFTVTEDKVIEWANFLSPYEYGFVMNNLKEHIKRSEFPPTVKDITQEKTASKNIAYTEFTEKTIEQREKEARELLKKYGVPDIDEKNAELPDFLKDRQRGEGKHGITNE